MKIAISFLKSKYDTLNTIKKINETNADFIHVDVMDGKFVPNTTEDFTKILKNSKKPLDVHLMVENPIDYIIKYKNLKPEFITIHSEIDYNLFDIIKLIKSYNIKVGISIKPNTSVESIKQYLNLVDNILIMSVEPGFGGQKFINEILVKINELKELREKNKFNYIISIDGGINNKTIDKVKNVDLIISGSFICMSDDYQNSINILKKN